MLVQSDHTRIFSRVSVGILGTLYGKRANLDPCKLVPPPFNIFGFLSTGQLYGTNKSRDTRTLRGIKCNALSSQYIATYRSTPTEEPTGRKVDSETSLQFRQCWRCFIKRIIRWCYVPMLRTVYVLSRHADAHANTRVSGVSCRHACCLYVQSNGPILLP